MRTIGKCLRPGGLCILGDGNLDVWDERKDKMQPAQDDTDNAGRSWLGRWMLEVRARMARNLQQRTSSYDELMRWLQGSGYFGEPEGKAYFSPINWAGNDIKNGHEIGQIMVKNILLFIESGKPLFLANGVSSDIVNTWVRNVHAELDEPVVRAYSKWDIVWTRKTGDRQI